MTTVDEELEKFWRSQLAIDYPQLEQDDRESILCWLLGEKRTELNTLSIETLEPVKRGFEFRYHILGQRYLAFSSTQAYRNLINRLGSIVVLRQKISAWVSLSRDRRRAVTDILQEIIQQMLTSDRYLQGQLSWIAKCTPNQRLRDTLLFATLEEYCLRPIRNQQPLLVYRFINFLHQSQRVGVTQVPNTEILQAISLEVRSPDGESMINVLDVKTNQEYCEIQRKQEQLSLTHQVKNEFSTYLQQQVGAESATWLQLYSLGYSQEEIAKQMGLSIKIVYRLREKVAYHAIRSFASKINPELVSKWLEISVKENAFGLTSNQWRKLCERLTPQQNQIIEQLKLDKSLAVIAKDFACPYKEITKQWSQIYTQAQAIRNQP